MDAKRRGGLGLKISGERKGQIWDRATHRASIGSLGEECNGDDGVLVRSVNREESSYSSWRELDGWANDGICRLPEV